MSDENARTDRLLAAVQRGHEAREGLAAVQPLLNARRDQLIGEAVAAFRGGGMDGTRALSYVAALSEIEALRQELEARIRQGNHAAQEVFAP